MTSGVLGKLSTGLCRRAREFKDAASSANDKARKGFNGLAVTVKRAGNRVVDSGRELTETCRNSKAARTICSRFTSTDSIQGQVENLKEQLSHAGVDDHGQLQAISEQTKGLIFETAERLSSQKLKGQLGRASAVIDSSQSDDLMAPPSSLATDLKQTLAQHDKQIPDEDLLGKTEAQLREIEELEEQLKCLHDIAIKLNEMVQDQGKTVSSLEDFVNGASLDVQLGMNELKDSKVTKNKNAKLKIAIGIALAILAAIALAIVIL